jgi:hypothetical protein
MFEKHMVLLDVVREFSAKEFPKEVEAKQEIIFTQEDVDGFIVAPLAANRCIKVTFEFSDIQEKE